MRPIAEYFLEMSVAVILPSDNFTASAMAMHPLPVPKSKALKILVGRVLRTRRGGLRRARPTLKEFPAEFSQQFGFRSRYKHMPVHGDFESTK